MNDGQPKFDSPDSRESIQVIEMNRMVPTPLNLHYIYAELEMHRIMNSTGYSYIRVINNPRMISGSLIAGCKRKMTGDASNVGIAK